MDLGDALAQLVKIPSIAFSGFPREPLDEAAALVKSLFPGARYVEVPDEAPSVYAEYGPSSGPTVLLYAHYDVQPAPGWDDAFTPTRRDGRLYGRGAADDKSGIVCHLGALQQHDFNPPVRTKVIIEGSEENGRQKILEVVQRDRDLLEADVMVIADGGNWKLGEPTLCTTLRGHGKFTVTLRTLENALHSGQFGGAAPDALLALTRLLASLHDERGNVAVGGLSDFTWPGTDLPETDFRRQAGVLDGVGLIGDGTVADRLWARHAISVLGLDAPAVEGAGNIVIPEARAKVAVRVPPGADPAASMDAVAAHLRAHTPWGARLELELEPASTPNQLTVDEAARRALEEAYGKPVAVMGSGGSVPLVAALRETYPDASIILWGAQDSDLARIHATGESVDLTEIERIARAQALLLSAFSR
jgi:cysteinylglycine-S-conjugate dipeptidase